MLSKVVCLTSNSDSIINNSMQVLSDDPELVSQRGMNIGDTPISPMALDTIILQCFLHLKLWHHTKS